MSFVLSPSDASKLRVALGNATRTRRPHAQTCEAATSQWVKASSTTASNGYYPGHWYADDGSSLAQQGEVWFKFVDGSAPADTSTYYRAWFVGVVDNASSTRGFFRASPLGSGASGMTSFTLAADSGTSQTISDGNTLTIAGGEGVTTTASATDTVTISLTAKPKYDATAPPSISDDSSDGYAVGSIWVDVTNDNAYILLDASVGAAVWVQIDVAAGITVEEADGNPSLTGITTLRFDQSDGFSVSNPAAGVARIDFTAASSGVTSIEGLTGSVDVSSNGTITVGAGGGVLTLNATVATEAQMETASSAVVLVTPGNAKHHPGVAKAWCVFDGTASSPITPAAGYNVSSVTKHTTGEYTVNFTTAFASADYACVATAGGGAAGGVKAAFAPAASDPTTSSIRVHVTNFAGSAVDAEFVNVVCFGTQ